MQTNYFESQFMAQLEALIVPWEGETSKPVFWGAEGVSSRSSLLGFGFGKNPIYFNGKNWSLFASRDERLPNPILDLISSQLPK